MNAQPTAPQPTPNPAAPAKAAVTASTTSTGSTAPTVAPTAPAAPLPNPLAHLRTPFQPVDYVLKGYHLDATVSPDDLIAAVTELDKEGFARDTITGVDWLAQAQMEVVYDFFHPRQALRVVIRSRVPRENPEVPTLSGVFPGANWHERETHDFFGIRFLGHPNLLPFLLPEDATYHPLRKDFTA